MTHFAEPKPAATPDAPPLGWLVFLAAATGASVASQWDIGISPIVLKAVPMAILLVFVGGRAARADLSRMRIFIWLGLVASLVGDMVIGFSFIGGIGAFLVAHLFYLLAMGLPRGNPAGQAAASIPALALLIGMGTVLSSRAPDELRIPVLVYLTVISTMLARATARAWVFPKEPWARRFFAGACFFALSDGMIAIDKWVMPLPYPHLAILATYYLGQWYISRGIGPR